MSLISQKKTRLVVALSAAVLVILMVSLLAIISAGTTHSTQPNASGSVGSITSASPLASPTTVSSTITTVSGSQTGNMRTIVQSIPPQSCQNCTFILPWQSLATVFPTLSALVNASVVVAVANVSSVWTVSRSGVPVTLYNVTVITLLKDFFVPVSTGEEITFGEIGGTNANESFALSGYPRLDVGSTYVLFLSPAGGIYEGNGQPPIGADAPFSDYVSSSSIITYMTEGGPQGLFYVQSGSVYSLDNTNPQADTWLQVKANGIPLAEFIAQVQSAA